MICARYIPAIVLLTTAHWLFPASAAELTTAERDRLRARLNAVSATLDEAIVKSGRELRHDAFEDYVEGVLARVEPERASEFSVVLLEDHEATAWIGSLPVIHLSTGLITLLENEAQLALILAHEVEHYRADHAVGDFSARLDEFRKGITLSYQLAAIFKSSARSIEHEVDADRAAIRAYLAAGYSPAAATGVFERYVLLDEANDKERDILYVSGLARLLTAVPRHPAHSERRDLVLRAIESHEGPTGDRVGRREYLEAVKGIGLIDLERSTLLRDGSRLRVYLGGSDALERYPDRIYYYSAEAFRLGGNEEERKHILPYYIKSLVDDPAFAEVHRAIARYKWRHGDIESARHHYANYLQRAGDGRLPDYLGQDLGLLENVPLARSFDHAAECGDNVIVSEKGHFSLGMPCGWHVSRKLPYSVRASRDGWGLNQVFAYSIDYDIALAAIDETVSEPADDKIDLLEMSRAAILKDDEDASAPAGTGFEEINGRRWGWYEYVWRDDDGLNYRARRYETIVGKRIVGIAYIAPELHYFQDGLEEFGQTLGSLRILNEPSPEQDAGQRP